MIAFAALSLSLMALQQVPTWPTEVVGGERGVAFFLASCWANVGDDAALDAAIRAAGRFNEIRPEESGFRTLRSSGLQIAYRADQCIVRFYIDDDSRGGAVMDRLSAKLGLTTPRRDQFRDASPSRFRWNWDGLAADGRQGGLRAEMVEHIRGVRDGPAEITLSVWAKR